MKCPACLDVELTVTTRHEIEIDVCRTCRGVWLDRGELDKMIARGARDPESHDDEDDDDFPRRRSSEGRRGRSWWTELFD